MWDSIFIIQFIINSMLNYSKCRYKYINLIIFVKLKLKSYINIVIDIVVVFILENLFFL